MLLIRQLHRQTAHTACRQQVGDQLDALQWKIRARRLGWSQRTIAQSSLSQCPLEFARIVQQLAGWPLGQIIEERARRKAHRLHLIARRLKTRPRPRQPCRRQPDLRCRQWMHILQPKRNRAHWCSLHESLASFCHDDFSFNYILSCEETR